jgi:hypothetical protein
MSCGRIVGMGEGWGVFTVRAIQSSIEVAQVPSARTIYSMAILLFVPTPRLPSPHIVCPTVDNAGTTASLLWTKCGQGYTKRKRMVGGGVEWGHACG